MTGILMTGFFGLSFLVMGLIIAHYSDDTPKK